MQKRDDQLKALRERVSLLETKLEHKNKIINELLDELDCVRRREQAFQGQLTSFQSN